MVTLDAGSGNEMDLGTFSPQTEFLNCCLKSETIGVKCCFGTTKNG